MKPIFIILLLFPALLFAQTKITDIPWVGQSKEYLYIEKKLATLIKGQHIQEFKVEKYVKNDYFILSSQHATGYYEQKYHIVLFTANKLILAPEGRDIFKLSHLNEQDQYVFENNLNEFTFVKLHFESSLISSELDCNLSFSLDIDSARNSRVKIHDDYMNETNVVTTSMSMGDYKRMVTILAGVDIGSFSEEFIYKKQEIPESESKFQLNSFGAAFLVEEGHKECSNSVFEIQYNDQIKKCKGCNFFPFYYPALEVFLMRYMAIKSNQSGRNPKIWY
jgi:hypothetical protein